MFDKIGQFFVMLYNDFFYLILVFVLALAVAVVLLILRHIRNSEEEKLQMQEDFKQQSIESLTSEEVDNISNNAADPEEVKQYLETEIDQAKKTAKKKQVQKENEQNKKTPLGIIKPSSKSKKSNPTEETAVTTEEPVAKVETTIKKQYTGKWKIVEDDEGFYAILTASNGGALLKTEKYKSIPNVRNGIETVKKNIEIGNFAISVDKNGYYKYKLFNSSNRLICVSENYSSKAKCEHGIESVKRFSQSATVIVEDK